MSEWIQKEFMLQDKPIYELDLGVIRCEIEQSGRDKYDCFIYSAENIYMCATRETLDKAKSRAEVELRRRLTAALRKLDGLEG